MQSAQMESVGNIVIGYAVKKTQGVTHKITIQSSKKNTRGSKIPGPIISVPVKKITNKKEYKNYFARD